MSALPGLSRRVLGVAAAALALATVWRVPLPPMSDLENHLARAHALSHLSGPLGEAYAPAWGPYPNLAFDLFAVPLAGVLDVVVVGKLFLSLTVLAWAAGCQALGWAVLGRASYRAALATLLVFFEPFLLGYVNFAFGMGLALLATALLVRRFETRGGPGFSLGVAALSLAVAASHAAALVTLGLAVAGLAATELRATSEPRRAVGPALSVAPGFAYLAAWLAAYSDPTRETSWASTGTSARILLLTITPSYEPRADGLILGALALSALLTVVLLRPARGEGAPDADGRRRAGAYAPLLLAAGLCAVAVFVSPADFAGSYEANGRYAVGAWVFAIFALPAPSAAQRRVAVVPLSLAALAILGRHALLDAAWTRLGRELERERALLAELPPNAVLANVTYLTKGAPRSVHLAELALLHAPALAVVDRAAVLPTLYAIPGVQPIAHKTPRYDAHRFASGAGGEVDVERILREMDAVWLCRGADAASARLRAAASVLGSSGDCELLLLRAPGSGDAQASRAGLAPAAAAPSSTSGAQPSSSNQRPPI